MCWLAGSLLLPLLQHVRTESTQHALKNPSEFVCSPCATLEYLAEQVVLCARAPSSPASTHGGAGLRLRGLRVAKNRSIVKITATAITASTLNRRASER